MDDREVLDMFYLPDGTHPKTFSEIVTFPDKRIAETWIATRYGFPARVSTVFLGSDMSFGLNPYPVLWETMVFVGMRDVDQVRYSSERWARIGHTQVVSACLASGDFSDRRVDLARARRIEAWQRRRVRRGWRRRFFHTRA